MGEKEAKKERADVLLGSDTDDSTASIHFCRHIGHILTLQLAADVAKVGHGGPLLVRLFEIEDGKLLVVRQRVDFGRTQEAGMVHRAVVEGLDDDIVFVNDTGVIDVDKAIGRAGKEYVWALRWVEAQLRHVVAVHFGVLDALGRGAPDVPDGKSEKTSCVKQKGQ